MSTNVLPTRIIRTSRRAVRPFFERAMSFERFYKTLVREMTPKQRALVVEQAILMFEGFYVHLPLKSAMYAVDPLRRLKLLQQQLEQTETLAHKSDQYFQREMMQIFASLCDQHTAYNLPEPYDEYHAWLPFKVETCLVRGRRKYLVTRTVSGFRQIRSGSEILSWNGIPIERALEVAEKQSMGGNAMARRALALFHLTIRPLRCLPPPEEEWVAVGYRSPDGEEDHEIWIRWVVSDLPSFFDESDPNALAIAALRVQHVRKILFAPQVVEFERRLSKSRDPYSMLKQTESIMPNVFSARSFSNKRGKFGYIRIFSFETPDPDKFVKEFIRLLGSLPQTGLIIDVRDNPGGKIEAAERLVQLIAPTQPVHPQVFYFINTARTLKLCNLHRDSRTTDRSVRPIGPLRPWIESMQRAMETGATYSSSFPLTDPALCRNIGRIYHGPVVVVTNSLSYSSAEIFAADFQDHGGTILGTDKATGGGGANVRTHGEMRKYFKDSKSSPFRPLPMGANMSIALRRAQRVGTKTGSEIEDFGVIPNKFHEMTRDDLLHKNCDLLEDATKVLDELKEQARTHPSPSKAASSKELDRKALESLVVGGRKIDGQRLAKKLRALAHR